MKTLKERLAYVRGFADGEGCISKAMGPNRKRQRIRRTIVIANTQRDLLLFCKETLEEVDISSSLFIRTSVNPNHKSLWILKISGYANLYKYHKHIGFSSLYKQQRLIEVLAIRPWTRRSY